MEKNTKMENAKMKLLKKLDEIIKNDFDIEKYQRVIKIREIEDTILEYFIKNNPFLMDIKYGIPLKYDTHLLPCLDENLDVEFDESDLTNLINYYDESDTVNHFIKIYLLFHGKEDNYSEVIKNIIKKHINSLFVSNEDIDDYVKNNYENIFELTNNNNDLHYHIYGILRSK